jgi:hypothetical protein
MDAMGDHDRESRGPASSAQPAPRDESRVGKRSRTDVLPAPRSAAPADGQAPQDERLPFMDAMLASRERDVPDLAGTNTDAPDRWASNAPDHEAKWAEVTRILDGNGDAKKLPALMMALGFDYRAKLAARLEDAAKVGRGDDILQLADMCDVTLTEKIRVAVSAKEKPTPAVMRGHLAMAGLTGIIEVIEDSVAGPALRGWHKGSALTLLPQLGNIDFQVALSGPTLQWLLDTAPARVVAYALMSGSSQQASKTLVEMGDSAWSWVNSVDAAMVSAFPVRAQHYAAKAPEAAKTKLDGLLSAIGSSVDADPADAAAKQTDTSELEAALGAKSLDMQKVLDAAAVNGAVARRSITLARNRKRILAAAKPEQVLLLGVIIGLEEHEHMDWLLDTPGIKPAHIAQAFNTWRTPLDAFDPKMRARLRKKWKDVARPIEVFGEAMDVFIDVAVGDPDEVEWLFARATPMEILQAVTSVPGNTTKYCRALERTKIKYGWVHSLGAGPNDPNLRVLAANCPDEKTAKFVRERLLGDYAGWFKEEDTVADTPAGSYDNARTRLAVGMAGAKDKPDGEIAKDLDTRVAELTATDLENLRAQPERLQLVLERAPAADRPRIIYDVQPTLAQLVAATPAAPMLNLAPYLRMRPDSEHLAALSNKTVAAGLRERFPRNPLLLFPTLASPANLDTALRGNPDLVLWIMTDTAAGPALHALGHPDVAEAAADAFSKNKSAVARIPAGSTLDADARKALERIRDNAPTNKLTREIQDELDDDFPPSLTVDKNAQAAERAEHQPLWKSLKQLLDNDAPVASLLTVCEQRRHEIGKLFKDKQYDPIVERLAAATQLSPLVVFPGLLWETFLYADSARKWLLTYEPSWVILGALQPSELAPVKKLAKLMDDFDGDAIGLLVNLPGPAGLEPDEARGLRLLFEACDTHIAQDRLFYTRWGATTDGRYDKAEMKRLWTLMERLPSAHVEQFAVKEFVSDPKKSNVLGLYGSQGISLYDKLTEEKKQEYYGQDEGVPRAQFMKIHGLTDAQFDAKLGKSIEELEVDGAKVYRYTKQKWDAFTAVALHEIGHAVDDMMGSRTELVYGMAGWHEHANAEFDVWADMMGGWDKVADSAKPKIREAWQMFLNSSKSIDGLDRSVGSMCSPEHPIHDAKLTGVGVVDMARVPKTGHRDPFFHNGRMWIINHHRKTWLSAKEEAVHASPTLYGRSAPAEFFAECYVDYYYAYDGKDPKKKGGRLAPWIKEWFDDNVDKLTFNPARDKEPDPAATP